MNLNKGEPLGNNSGLKKGEYHSLKNSPATTTVNNYRLILDMFYEDGNGLHEVYNDLMSAGKDDKLEVRFMSPGGLVTEGQTFYNIFKNKFNGRVTGYLDSHASSMGALLFSACDKRIVFENSRLMYHDYAGGSIGKGGNMVDHVNFTAKHIRRFFKAIIMEQGFLTKKEFKHMVIGKDYWFEAMEMLERGIATHIIVDGEEMDLKQYKKLIKNRRKQLKK